MLWPLFSLFTSLFIQSANPFEILFQHGPEPSPVSILEHQNAATTKQEERMISYSENSVSTPFIPLNEVDIDEEKLEAAMMARKNADMTEERLYQHLLRGYEKDIRPTLHHSLPTNCTFGFLLNQIVEMDEKNQILLTRSWMNINWLDQRLIWNQTLWGGIKTIYVPHAKIWKPDVLSEKITERLSEKLLGAQFVNIMRASSALKLWCQATAIYYPFDQQECDLKFASWSHDLSEIDLQLNSDKGDLSNYLNNSEFDLLDMLAIKEVVRFPTGSGAGWPMILIRIKLHRRPLFYVFNHILPCILISSMAILGFLMPPETGEKINMIITTLLSMGVYLQSINQSIPPSAEAVPLIGMYYVASLLMVCMATFVNVVTLNIHRNGSANQGRQVPYWLQKWVLGYLASLMRISIREPDSLALLKASQSKKSTIRRSSILRDLKRIKNEENKKGVTNSKSNDICECMQASKTPYALLMLPGENGQVPTVEAIASESAFLGRMVTEQLVPRMSSSKPVMISEFEERFRRILKRVYRSLQQHEIREEVLDERARIQWQWHLLASVVDRLLLFLFCGCSLMTIFCLLVSPVAFREQHEAFFSFT
ncbi:hypothetical protein WR25_14389 [Diploscapter pachys]|uniref:Neurotransmitter-gated ion-channel ligand-binding domain-containing protein n=1 Tax=Diploscapter pachys TaxID=2018661 RepID=A0A2A2LHX4_9BILA|nr:hypothetical protein WR25_14389 [Diploscapter pachys]